MSYLGLDRRYANLGTLKVQLTLQQAVYSFVVLACECSIDLVV
jgi:hypothetical protein